MINNIKKCSKSLIKFKSIKVDFLAQIFFKTTISRIEIFAGCELVQPQIKVPILFFISFNKQISC